MTETQQQSKHRQAGLDVVRGIAIALVILCHTEPETFNGAGLAGVGLFFVLSGYLITGVLRHGVAADGRIRFGRFYAHRAFRLLPALFTMLIIAAFYAVAQDLASVSKANRSVLIGLFYVADTPTRTLAPFKGLGHIWTLSVEEQFYFVWPALLALALTRFGVGRTLAVAAVALVVGDFVLAYNFQDVPHLVYQAPTTWGLALLAGAACNLYRERLRRLAGPGPAVVAAIVLIALSFVRHAASELDRTLPMAFVIAAAGSVVVLNAAGWTSLPPFARPLVGLGVISYGAYIWNYPITIALPPTNNRNMPFGWAMVALSGTFLAALLSWFTVEAAGRAGRRAFDRRQTDRLLQESSRAAVQKNRLASMQRTDSVRFPR